MSVQSLWAKTATPFTNQTPALTGTINTGVAIIGAGYTGLSCALRLAEQGIQVCVVETEHVGFGGSGRNVGLVNAGLWTEPDIIDGLLGDNYGPRLYQALSDAPNRVFDLIAQHGMQCEATRNGTLQLAANKTGLNELDRRFQQLTKRGAPVKRLDAKATQSMLGSSYYQGAIWDHRAGTIQPLGYATGLATAAQQAGAIIYEHCSVNNLARSKKGWQLSTATGQVQADKVVVATNGYTGNLLPQIAHTYVPINFFQYATQPLTEQQRQVILPQLQGCWDTALVMTSIRLDAAGRLIIGSLGHIADGGQSGFLKAWAAHQINKFFPQLQGIKLDYCWSGRIAYSHDNLPHLHELEDGLITTMGYSGRGIGPGTVMGEAMADFILGKSAADLPLPVTSPTSIQWRKLKEAYYETGADLYHLSQRVI